MNPKRTVMGLFSHEDQAVSAVQALARSAYTVENVHSPIPSEELLKALKRPTSRVGYFTLAGGILGFFIGMGLAVFTATRWGLIVGGKPVVAWVPFFIVGFECTILFAVFGNIVGFILKAKLPSYKGLKRYDARCSDGHYGILAACAPGEENGLRRLFEEKGAEQTVLQEPEPEN